MLRNEFTCMNRRLVNIESNIEKLAARCEKIPIMSSDVAACRRELSEVREVIDNMTAVHSQRQLEIFMHQLVLWYELMHENRDFVITLVIVITVRIVVSGQNFPFRQTLTGRCYWLWWWQNSHCHRPFSSMLARRLVTQSRHAKASIKAAIRCLIQDKWAVQRMSMLGWRIVQGRKTTGFKSFHDLRQFIITTLNEVSGSTSFLWTFLMFVIFT